MKLNRMFATTIAAAAVFTLAACSSEDTSNAGGDDTTSQAPEQTTPATTDDPAPAGAGATQAPEETTPSELPTTAPGTTTDDDDVPVTDPELRAELERIALAEVGEGTVTEVEHNRPDADDNDLDDRDHAYQVEVTLANGEDVTVDIAENMSVVRVED